MPRAVRGRFRRAGCGEQPDATRQRGGGGVRDAAGDDTALNEGMVSLLPEAVAEVLGLRIAGRVPVVLDGLDPRHRRAAAGAGGVCARLSKRQTRISAMTYEYFVRL
jgi:hypothetical protein